MFRLGHASSDFLGDQGRVVDGTPRPPVEFSATLDFEVEPLAPLSATGTGVAVVNEGRRSPAGVRASLAVRKTCSGTAPGTEIVTMPVVHGPAALFRTRGVPAPSGVCSETIVPAVPTSTRKTPLSR